MRRSYLLPVVIIGIPTGAWAVLRSLAAGSALDAVFYLLAALVPVLTVVHLFHRTHSDRVEQRRQHLELGRIHLNTVEALAMAFDAKDPITYGHVRRVRAYAAELASLAGVTNIDELMAIEMAALLHDIGKIAVDDSLLTKPGPLTDLEFEEMKRHTTAGSEIVAHIRDPYPVATFVRSHHEKWDGSGYPDGLKGEEIPLGARILAIVDAFDAARSERPYKRAANRQDCLDALLAGAGAVYDPHLARLFVDNIDLLEFRASQAAQPGNELSFHRSPESLRVRPDQDAADEGARQPVMSLELASLEYFCKGIGGELELDDLLGALARRARRIVPAETCVIYLQGTGGGLTARAADGLYAARIEGIRLPWGRGLSGWVAAQQKPIVNGDPKLDLEELEEAPLGLADALVVPLSAGGVAIGVLAVYAGLARSFGAVHLELASEVVRAASGIVDRARNREGRSAGRSSPEGESRTYPASHFSGVASALIRLASEAGRPLSFACIDFETPGSVRPAGIKAENRQTQQRIAALVRAELPQDVSLFNFGEHRLVAVFQGLDRVEAQARGQRLQVRVRNMSVAGIRGPSVACQVAVVNFPDDGTSVKSLLEAAERRLAGLYVPERERFLRVRKPAVLRKPSAVQGDKLQQ